MSHFLKNRVNIFNAYFLIGIIFVINILIRIVFIFYGFISHDEGIAFYNAKLAYSGLTPFIDYNGWNSLANDYFFGFSRLFIEPTIFSQRLFALVVGVAVFWITISIAHTFQSRIFTIYSALFLTLGSITYTYYSNIPYSVQLMTLLLMVSLLFFVRTLSRPTRIIYEYLTLATLIGATLVRSQTLPLIFLFFLYFYIKRSYSRDYLVKMGLFILVMTLFFYGSFFYKSWEHTLYAMIWPFFATKLLVYVHDVPKFSVAQITTFFMELFRDYGLLLGIILGGSLSFVSWKDIKKSPRVHFIILCNVIIAEFLFISIFHTPMDATYMYPAVPIMALVAAYFIHTLCSSITTRPRIFVSTLILAIIFGQTVSFPHYKILKTEFKSRVQTPHTLLKDVSKYIDAQTQSGDEVVAFYLPAITELKLQVPLYLNEGPGSLSIADEAVANKFHLTTLPTFRTYIASQKAKHLILPSTAIHFMGVTDEERKQTWDEINTYYILDKEFPQLRQIDGSNASLLLFRLPAQAN